MGGTASKFDETDWETANGGLKDESQTLDGAKPVPKYSNFVVVKHALTNRREFDVRDHQDIKLYSTRKVDGTHDWFDVLDKGGLPLIRVECNLTRSEWTMYSFNKPAFVGQQPDVAASEKASGQSLYKKACMSSSFDKTAGTVLLYVNPSTSSQELQQQETEEQTDGSSETLDPTGVLDKEPILKITGVRGMQAKFQTFLPTDDTQLVGYWSWENSLSQQKMKFHLAQGTDLILHAILGIVTNIVREQGGGAGAMAGAGVY